MVPRVPSTRMPYSVPEALDHPLPIGVGLQADRAPQPRVAERAVVEVHRVLRRDDHAHAERARLLHQRDERALGRWVRGVRREEPVHLVEDHERAQRLAAREAAHPREHLLEHHAEHELTLVVVEVRDAHDRRRCLALDGLHPRADVERRALSPRRERRRREQRVERRREVLSLLGREELVHARVAFSSMPQPRQAPSRACSRPPRPAVDPRCRLRLLRGASTHCAIGSRGRTTRSASKQVGEIALHVDDEDGDLRAERLFDRAPMTRPVLPLPVMPTITAWVRR
jgi:hypothetical protein